MRRFAWLLFPTLIAGSSTSSADARTASGWRVVHSIDSLASDVVRSGEAQNLILFIADGFGPSMLTLGRAVSEYRGTPYVLDDFIVGTSITKSASSRITDSAASATALAAGIKTYNGAIGVDVDRSPVTTVLEAAEALGKSTGLVATSSITHATPASFSAHVSNRASEEEIAAQQIAKGIEVLFGGGIEFFMPRSRGGERRDNRDLVREAAQRGYQVVTTRATMLGIKEAPVLGLFSAGHMSFEIDRDPAQQPSLREMTAKAIDLLADDEDGFLLMVEGSRIDHAGHQNDPVALAHDVIALNDAVSEALDFARENGNTLVVLTADHETGGLALGRDGIYEWRPQMLVTARKSFGAIAAGLRRGGDIWRAIEDNLGMRKLEKEDQKLLFQAFNEDGREGFIKSLSEVYGRQVGIGWTSIGHTGVDVPLAAYGPGYHRLVGSHEISEIGRLIAEAIGVDILALNGGPLVAD